MPSQLPYKLWTGNQMAQRNKLRKTEEAVGRFEQVMDRLLT